jgi:hypothetical protein
VLDCGIEQLVGLFAGDAGMLENVLVKFRIGQLQLKESEVACRGAGRIHCFLGPQRVGTPPDERDGTAGR